MVVLAHYLSIFQQQIGKPVPASHLALTSFRLCEGASLPSVGLAVILVFHVSKAQYLHLSPSNMIDSFTLSKASFSSED